MLPSIFRRLVFVSGLGVLFAISPACGVGGSSSTGGGISFEPGTPKITSLSPSRASPGDAAFVLSVYGTNLSVEHSVVCWNGQDRPTGLSCAGFECLTLPPHVDAQISAGDIATAGSAQITVHNPGTVPSNALTFEIGGSSPPHSCVTCIDQIIPSEIVKGGRAFTLTINGQGFFPSMAVMWDNLTNPTTDFQRPTTYISYNQMVANIPASDIQVPGSVYVYVMDTIPSGLISNKVMFVIK
jgi:hypothetical protein